MEEILEGQKSIICIGWGLVRDDGRESFCMVLVGSVGRLGETAVQGREKTGEKP